MVPQDQISPLEETKTSEANVVPELETNPAKSFMNELQELDNQDDCVFYYDELEPDFGKPETIADDADVMGYQSIEALPEFVAMLERLMHKDSMSGKKSAIQYMIDNPRGWSIDEMIKAFEALVLTPILIG